MCAVISDGREWSCRLHAEIESSCSKVQYKEKGSILQIVMNKRIPFNNWPTLMVWTDLDRFFFISWCTVKKNCSFVLFLSEQQRESASKHLE